MKPKKKQRSRSKTAGLRPFNSAIALAFAGLAIAGFWKMRVEPARQGVPVDLAEKVFVEKRHLDGSPLKIEYTGFGPIDGVLCMAVASFIPGAAGWEPEIRLQQMYFLFQYFAVSSIRNIEAYRKRNSGRLITFNIVFGVLEQMIGGATIFPIYYLLYVLSSAKDEYFASGREVYLGPARDLLPSLLVGYLLPTILVFLPWQQLTTAENYVAVWYFAPTFPGILVFILTFGGLGSSFAKSTRNSDVKHLRRIYLIAGLVTSLSHIGVIYLAITSTDPRVSLASVLLPDKTTWKADAPHGLHWIFQWDFWICFGVSWLWCLLAVVDIWRIAYQQVSAGPLLMAASAILVISLLGGPGTAMAALWYWREERMLALEDDRVAMKMGNPRKTRSS